LIICGAPLAACGSAQAQSTGTPAAVVTAFHAALLDDMKHGKQYGCDGRIQRLAPVIDATFDTPYLAERVLRRDWPSLTPEERSQFVAAFKDSVTITYASEFSSYDADVFSTLDTQAMPNGNQLVHSRLKPGNGDSHTFDYVLHSVDSGWRVINVISDGVSSLSLQSEQYTSVFAQKGGFDGLMAWLQAQTHTKRSACEAKAGP
jgi:phospholipid transport system substrate-binding protein